jgi:hypothetical protein
MAQATRTLVSFLVAPAIPAALLYLYNVWQGYGNAAVVGPYILTLLGYVAALIIGVPVYLLLQRKEIRSLPAYVLVGALIGPVFYLLFVVLTAYPGQLMLRLAFHLVLC